MRPYPGWYFGIAENSTELRVQLRHAIWNTCRERRLQKPIACRWYHRSRINLCLGNDVSRATYIGGCIEPNEFAFIGSVLKKGMVMIDVGANDGLFTIFAARRVGRKGRVIAFEPSAREFARLQTQCAVKFGGDSSVSDSSVRPGTRKRASSVHEDPETGALKTNEDNPPLLGSSVFSEDEDRLGIG